MLQPQNTQTHFNGESDAVLLVLPKAENDLHPTETVLLVLSSFKSENCFTSNRQSNTCFKFFY